MKPSARPQYSYDLSVKSEVSDELINTYVLRPVAGSLVRILYRTPITPNQVTVAATLIGLVAALFYFAASPISTLLAGICITLKDLLDSADGQLARAKHQYSRSGRFLDSIGDFLVNLGVFAAIGQALTSSQGGVLYAGLAVVGFFGLTLRVSYHVYYHTSFLHLQQRYAVNRITEEIREEDFGKDRMTLTLQRIFQFLYGWQDRWMARIDRWCRGDHSPDIDDTAWFADRIGLRLSGLLGLGSELFLLTVCSVTNQLVVYLWCNLGLMNGIWLASIWYRRRILAHRATSVRVSGSAYPRSSREANGTQ
jgi:phosphatidylglycerophosphate synthase